MSLRLGVNCAVVDDAGQVLLSQRGDLAIWNLPGGRLDSGELLSEAAAREVHEETGVIAQVEAAVGLYYWDGWQRMNILYRGWPLGGALVQRTPETHANRYFSPQKLPETLHTALIRAALNAKTRPLPQIIALSPRELRRVKNQLRWRWASNLLRGQLEPRFPVFQVYAVGIIWDVHHRRILTLSGPRSQVLPRVFCRGDCAPWQELAALVEPYCKITSAFRWVGLWQDPPHDQLEFVFAAITSTQILPETVQWSSVQNVALGDRDLAYVGRVKASYAHDPVWMMQDDSTIGPGETIAGYNPPP